MQWRLKSLASRLFAKAFIQAQIKEENSPETGEFPAQRASNAEDVSILWRHHASEINKGAHCHAFLLIYTLAVDKVMTLA